MPWWTIAANGLGVQILAAFGPHLKFAGYGAVFTGISPRPVYLFIDNGKAELRDAATVGKILLRQKTYSRKWAEMCVPSGLREKFLSPPYEQPWKSTARSASCGVGLKNVAVKGTTRFLLWEKAKEVRKILN